MYGFTEEYEEIPAKKCLLEPFYLHKDYNGRKTEEAFVKYLDQQEEIEWWFKNGDNGKDWLAIRYFNDVTKQDALFYPDWVYKKKDGTIGIFDTKGGITASDPSTKNKTEALQKRLLYMNSSNEDITNYEGGIVRQENGMWYFTNNNTYNYQSGNTNGWKNMNDLFSVANKSATSTKTTNILDIVSIKQRYTTHLPVYSLHAACGYFEENGKIQDDDAEGWIDVSGHLGKTNDKMFVVHAEGNSMEPLIHDGDLCVFDACGAGSNEGKIVLAKAKDKDDPNASSFTIKKYHSEKVVGEDGNWKHSRITLSPLNADYKPIVINADEADDDDFKIYGEFVTTIV